MPARKKDPAQFRAEFLQAINEHKSVTDLCAKFNISRKTYYKWKTISEKENHTESRQPGRKTIIDDRILTMVKEVIVANPEWSVDKIYAEICKANNGEQLVSRSWIQYQLEKSKLSTHAKRRIYSFATAPQSTVIQPAPLVQVEESITLPKQQVFAAGNSSPPSFYTATIYNKIHQLYQAASPHISPYINESHKKQFREFTSFVISNPHKAILTIAIAISNAYLMSIVGNAVINAEGIGQKTGMLFSALALFCGTFFFLYSLKYYITIVAVILQSRNKSRNFQPISDTSFKAKILNILGSTSTSIVNKIQAPHTNPIELQQQVVKEQLNEYPFFSVQIPLYNEKKVANRVVAAAVAMDYPNFEVIVCDDSTDETTQLLREKWGTHPKVRILHRDQRTGYKGAALDNALKFMDARTDYVVVFDADFVPYPDTLNLFAKYFAVIGRNERNNTINQASSAANGIVNSYSNDVSDAILTSRNQAAAYYNKTVALQGYQWHVLNKSENWITRAVRTEFSGSYIIERSGTQLFSLLKQIAGSVYAINATVLKETGWGTSITEDFQLTLKLYEKGYKVAYTPYIQAPSECVSTLKRLIRQRQRWAEGHSHNMKLRLHQLLSSPNMSAKEKWETVYLAPYYLQSFIFIIGTVAWIIAEVIFKVKLPFWTAALGWSLVLTNLFSLPLMNTIGLFLEEGEERDYLGIFSFVTLCYILAPFIGWAALKGFIEKEEGPWFRTPKSGRITDKVERTSERKSERISKYIPWMRPALDIIRKAVPEVTNPISSQYLAFATAGNTFKTTNWAVRSSKIKKRLVHTIVLALTGITALTNVLQTSVPQAFANPDTYYARYTDADNLNSTGANPRKEGNTTIGASAQTQTLDATNTTFYMLTDNLNKRWTNDVPVTDTNTGLTGYWKLDECTGATAADSSGYSNDGTIDHGGSGSNTSTGNCSSGTGTEMWNNGTTGKAGASLDFDGTNDYAAMTTAAQLQGGTALTLSAWVKPATLTGNHSPVGFFGSGSDKGYWFNIPSTGEAQFYISRDGSGQDVIGAGAGTAPVGSWTHIVATYDGSTISIYTNGTFRDSVLQPGTIHTVTTSSAFAIGRLGALSSDYYDGQVDDVRAYNRVLSDADIQSLYQTERRNVQVATHTDGSTVAVWEDARMTTAATQDRFDNTRGNVTIARQNSAIASTDNGKILIAGGIDEAGVFRSSAEIYDPVTNTFTLASNHLPTLRSNAEAVTLDDSRVLILGGRSATSTVVSTAQLFNGQTNTAAATGALSAARTDGPAIKLHNGMVLRVGGCSAYTAGACSTRLSAAELFDPGRARWSAVGSLVSGSRANSRAALLPNGEVLVVGGYDGTNRLSTSEIYDPVSATWRRGPSMSAAREEPGVTSLINGSILVVGGYDGTNYLSSSELFDPYAQTWTTLSSVHSNLAGTYKPNGLVQLGNGKVLIAGATEATNNGSSTAMVYEPLTQSYSLTKSFMQTRRENVSPILTQTGKVLFAGGQQGTASISNAELYTPITYDIYAQKYDKTGAKQWGSGTDIRVNSDAGNRASSTGPSNYNHLNPTVTLDSSGNAIVAWEEQRSSVFNSEIWSQKLAVADGAKQWPLGTQNAFAAAPGTITYNRQTNNVSAGVRSNLLSNGKTLITGTETNNVGRSMPELYDPVANTFTVGPMMARPRFGHTATTLLDGRVLLVGSDVSAATGSIAEIFNPVTNTWATTGNNLAGARSNHTGTLMKDGRVLIVGGRTSATSTALTTVQIFNPATGTFAAGAGILGAAARDSHAAVALPNGKVLVVGDQSADADQTAAILYDPLANTWSAVPGAHQRRYFPQLVLLNNGKVLSVGDEPTTRLTTSELYDPSLNTWTQSALMNVSRSGSAELTVLPNGKVLAVGGYDGAAAANVASGEIYDPATNTWSALGTSVGRAAIYNPITYNPIDNKFLILGGTTTGATNADLFTPAGDMPVSAHQFNIKEVYKNSLKDRGALTNIQYRKPQAAIDSDGNAIIVWHEQEMGVKEFNGVSHTNDANAYRMYNSNSSITDQCASSDGCGSQPIIASKPIQIVGQKICNASSGCDTGTTSGERQWGTEQETVNKNNPKNKTIANIKDAQNTAIVNDGTNVVVTYQSNGDVSSVANKNSKIYAQKIDTNGKVVWSSPWTATTGNMTTNRRDLKVSPLASGKALITGGQNSAVVSTAEVFDPKTGLGTTATNFMAESRIYHQATLLSNGQTLITGGGTSASTSTTTANLFTESGASGTFTSPTGGMVVSRAEHTATALKDGRVLIAGGRTTTTAVTTSEVFTQNTSVFTASGNFRTGARYNHEATMLKNGRVLIAGGTNGTGPISTAEFYDPATSTWNAAHFLTTKRMDFTLTPLNDGRVLAVGGTDGTNRLSTVEIYTPDINSWTVTNSLVTGLRSGHTSALLPSGHIVVYGGTSNGTDELTTSEIYDPTTGTWTAFLNSNTARKNHGMITLNNGQTYVLGGWDDTTTVSSAEYFSLDQKISVADNTNSLKPDLVKDSDNNFQVVWQAWQSEGLYAGNSGGAWKVVGQKLNNPASGSTTKLWPTGTVNEFSGAASMPGGARTAGGIGVLPNGKILLAGGTNGTTYSTSLLYDPAADTWTSTGNLNTPRESAFLTVLTNGKALIVGGSNGGTYLSTAELYDPSTGTWTYTGNNLRNGVRAAPAVVQLTNGKVLIAGGNTTAGLSGISTSELFDPSTNTWTATTGSFRGGARAIPSYSALPNGQVLVASGFTGAATLTTSEIYNPATDTWTLTTGSLRNGGRIVGSTISLNTGKILFAGGTADLVNVLSTAEIFDPLTQTWTNTSFLGSQRLSSGISALPSGKILMAGGGSTAAYLSSSEIYDPLTATWTAGPFLPSTRAPVTQYVNLKDGRIFFPGGQTGAATSTAISTAVLYNPELSEKVISSDDSNRRFNQVEARIASDSASGSTYVTWEDDRYTSPSDTTIDKNVYMQKVGATGVPLWPNGDNTNGTYNVRDIRVNSTRGSLDTTVQVKPAIGKRVLNDTDNKSVFITWTDMRDGAPSTNIYGQSFDTLSRSMTSTSWTAYFVLNAVGSGDTVSVQVGANEADGESSAFNSTTGTFSGTSDPTDGEKSIVFSDLPPTGETDLTHKRLYMKITRTGGTMTLRYNGANNASSSIDADTRLDVGIVVPERTALLGFIIPFLPVMIMGYKRRKYFRQKLEKVYKKP